MSIRTLCPTTIFWVGLDVHKGSITTAVFCDRASDPRRPHRPGTARVRAPLPDWRLGTPLGQSRTGCPGTLRPLWFRCRRCFAIDQRMRRTCRQRLRGGRGAHAHVVGKGGSAGSVCISAGQDL